MSTTSTSGVTLHGELGPDAERVLTPDALALVAAVGLILALHAWTVRRRETALRLVDPSVTARRPRGAGQWALLGGVVATVAVLLLMPLGVLVQRSFGSAGLALPERETALGVVGLSLPQAMAAIVPHLGPPEVEALVGHYRASFTARRAGSDGVPPLYPGARAALGRALLRRAAHGGARPDGAGRHSSFLRHAPDASLHTVVPPVPRVTVTARRCVLPARPRTSRYTSRSVLDEPARW